MKAFTVQLTRAAGKDLERLSLPDRDQVSKDFLVLKKNPFGAPPLVKRLKGFPFQIYRLRSGDFRVLYRVDNLVVTVMRVINRKGLEPTLRHLRSM